MTRALSAAGGVAVLALVWSGLPAGVAGGPFTAHMLRHMGVVAVAAPLLALAVAGTRLDPSRRPSALFAAVPAALVELVVVWGWHVPALHLLAWRSDAAAVAEQASFLAAGLLVWIACLGHAPGRERPRAAAGVVGLLLTSMHMTLLGVLIALAPVALYPLCSGGAGLSPIDDQVVGGTIMLLAGGAAYLAGGLALTARLLADGASAPPAPDRA